MIKYKETNIPWIGSIPSDWSFIRFKDKYLNKKEIVGDKVEEYERLALTLKGVVKRNKNDDDGLQPKDFSGYQIINEGDFIFKMIDLQNVSTSRVGLSGYTGIVSPAYIRFVPKDKGKTCKFTYYFLMSLYYNCVFNNLGGNGVRSALNATDMGNFIIPYPNDITRNKIVEVIESRIERINRLIQIQNDQIKNLDNYKYCVIRQAVTKGLNDAVSLKDSGIEWASKIPEHWDVKPNKYIMKKIKNICEVYEGEDVLSLSVDGVKKRNFAEGGKMPSSFDGYQYINKGNLLMCLFDYDVTPCCIGLIKDDGVTSPAYSHFEMKEQNNPGYYYYYYWMLDYTKELLHLSKNLRYSFTEEQLGAIRTVVPPLEEQQEIASYLDVKVASIDKLIKLKKQKIEKLNEYKKSLIYEYVTGKREIKEG